MKKRQLPDGSIAGREGAIRFIRPPTRRDIHELRPLNEIIAPLTREDILRRRNSGKRVIDLK